MILSDIAEKAKLFWKYTYKLKPPLEPKKPIICHICYKEMVFKSFRVHERNYKNPKAHRWRIDITFKCMQCGHIETFGVPVDKNYWEYIRDLTYKYTGSYNSIVEAAENYGGDNE